MIGKHNAGRGACSPSCAAARRFTCWWTRSYDEGIAVPFFGRDAMTTPVPAALALKTGARILIARNRRLPGARFQVTVHAGAGIYAQRRRCRGHRGA